uniref:Uncharacterized protein n=1 Tax=uncultured Nocardioidaceae bacterium TaxID=253824 RepID=A0A6J4M5K2_9ACTN|nr:MAG: hypothetical protein AVDCRST_MAG46-2570 [uncultured Nocardioidaceae bacterium]
MRAGDPGQRFGLGARAAAKDQVLVVGTGDLPLVSTKAA